MSTFALFATTQVFGSEIVRCRQKEVVNNVPVINELLIYAYGGTAYSYYAKRCEHAGNYCDSSTASYESEGSVEREFLNGYPTRIFKGSEISITPLCAEMLAYRDTGATSTGFVFRKEECAFAEVITGKGRSGID